MSLADDLRAARVCYAAAPSHAPLGETPARGTFCMISACYADGRSRAVEDALLAATRTWSLADFNATHTTEEVLAVFDRAIARA